METQRKISMGKLSLNAATAMALGALLVPGLQAQVYNFTTIAGTPGLDFRDGTNASALFDYPWPAASDASGNIYVADASSGAIRRLTLVGTNWVVTTLAGGVPGYSDGTNGTAHFNSPGGIAVDTANNIYVADSGNDVIRKISASGTNWVVTTWAGRASFPGGNDSIGSGAQFNYPQGLAVDHVGNLYVADTGNHAIRKITSAGSVGQVTTIAGTAGSSFLTPEPGFADGSSTVARFHSPAGIAVDAMTNIYVADTGNDTIRRIALKSHSWTVSTLAGSVTNSGGADGTNDAATFNLPAGICVDGATNLFIADSGNHTLRQVSPSGTNWVVSTLAGLAGQSGTADGTNSYARFQVPKGIALVGSGTLVVADTFNQTLRRIVRDPNTCTVTTIAGNPTARQVDGAGVNATFWLPRGITTDGQGAVYVADRDNQTIRKLARDANGWTVSTIAGMPGAPGSADGTNSNIRFNAPGGITLDTSGNLYVADSLNYTVRQLVPDGTNWIARTIAGSAGMWGTADGTNSDARFALPFGIAADVSGNLFVGDAGKIRTLAPSGTNWVVTTIVGLSAGVYPEGIAVDSEDNLYIADGYQVIRKISPSGTNWVVSTIAGGSIGYADGTNGDARFYNPVDIALDAAGRLYVPTQ